MSEHREQAAAAHPAVRIPQQVTIDEIAAPTAGGDPHRAARRASQGMVVLVLGEVTELGAPPGSVVVGGVAFSVHSLRGRNVLVSAAKREQARAVLESDLPPSGWGDESSPQDRRWRARKQMQRQAELGRLRRLLEGAE